MISLPTFEELPPVQGGVSQFISLIEKNFPCAHNYFRGVSNTAYDLKPTLGRLVHYKAASAQEKIEIESSFLSRSYQARVPYGPACYNEIAAAIAAQHHGAPTRLLDWSDSPLVALFFATEPKINQNGQIAEPTSDAAVWIRHECPIMYSADGSIKNRSFKFDVSNTQNFRDINWEYGSSGFESHILTPRISAQLGSFTICEKPEIDLRCQPSSSITNIWKVVLPRNEISTIQQGLYRLGIRKRSIYPDEDGLNTSLAAESLLDSLLEKRCVAG